MSKQLRIWLFVLLGTLLASSSLLAEGVITMTTTRVVTERIALGVSAKGNITIEGALETGTADYLGRKFYTLTSQTITIRGNVTELNCNINNLTSLDISGCTALTTLDCWWNSLTSLNVSGCTALTTLNCGSNQLTSLDVSGCTSLRTLNCHVNQLTNLDLSGCATWTVLNCDNNQLTSLNVSGCATLTELNCNNNQLTSLNVSGCTALTTLTCNDNKLTSLNLSDCTSLTQLTCQKNQLISLDLSKNHALAMLDCSDNKLPSLDLSDHKALAALNCSKNLLRKIELSGCTSLLSLTCHMNQIKVREMANLVNSLPDLGSKVVGAFRVFYDGGYKDDGNVCLAAHVATAQAKGWKTQFTRDYDGNAWYDYTGADNPLYAVTSSSTDGGSISLTGADDLTAVPYGTELTIIATPNEGYELTALTANGTDILATKTVVVTDNLNVKATFTKKIFAVKLTKEGEGTLSATGADDLNSVAYGTELTIVATPDEGYELTTLTANGTDILATKTVVVTDNLNVKATFANKKFAVTLTSNEHGKITIAELVDLKAVPYGTKLTVKATGKNAQCVLTALTANGEDILATQSFVVKGATEVKATFVDHTGVEMTVTQQTQLYPNPATDYVIVEGVAPASEVTLHSMTGERLYAGRADSRGTLRIDLTPYADGVYLVCVAGETYRVVVRR